MEMLIYPDFVITHWTLDTCAELSHLQPINSYNYYILIIKGKKKQSVGWRGDICNCCLSFDVLLVVYDNSTAVSKRH
jgi:hypothetical protein